MSGEVVYATTDATLSINGDRVQVARGEVWDAGDPLVAQHPDLFVKEPSHTRSTSNASGYLVPPPEMRAAGALDDGHPEPTEPQVMAERAEKALVDGKPIESTGEVNYTETRAEEPEASADVEQATAAPGEKRTGTRRSK